MNKYLDKLESIELFKGFNPEDISAMLKCLGVTPVTYQKNQCIVLQETNISQAGFIIEGKAKIQKEDINGNVVTISELYEGDSFFEDFVCAKVTQAPLSVWAVNPTTVIFLDYSRIITACPAFCDFHRRLIANMFRIMANKLILANQKTELLKRITIRDKLMAFFKIYMEKSGSNHFSIPFNRNDLAEYIGVNRSAMSRELCNMRDEGLIEFSGNTFYVK